MANKHHTEIEAISTQLSSLLKSVQGDEAARKQLLGVTMGAASQLETPLETCWRMIMSPHAPAALMTLMNMGAIDALAKASEPVSSHEIAKTTNSDALLIGKCFLKTVKRREIVH